jgi:hypothetical protein
MFKSNYERDLKDLTSKPVYADKLVDFKIRYETLTSRRFDDALDYLLASNAKWPCDPDKYSFLKNHVEWELIGVQPMRYVLDQTEKALCALLFTAGAAKVFASLAERAACPTVDAKSAGQLATTTLRLANRLRRLAAWFVWFNMLNLAVKFGTYKRTTAITADQTGLTDQQASKLQK